eukprot:7384200-Prymnesium_polylepis.1
MCELATRRRGAHDMAWGVGRDGRVLGGGWMACILPRAACLTTALLATLALPARVAPAPGSLRAKL